MPVCNECVYICKGVDDFDNTAEYWLNRSDMGRKGKRAFCNGYIWSHCSAGYVPPCDGNRVDIPVQWKVVDERVRAGW